MVKNIHGRSCDKAGLSRGIPDLNVSIIMLVNNATS